MPTTMPGRCDSAPVPSTGTWRGWAGMADDVTPPPAGPDPWRTLGTREVYDNAWIRVREDRVVRPDGAAGIYGVVSFKTLALGAVVRFDNDDTLLVGQHRYTVGAWSWEIPEGGAHPAAEPARRGAAGTAGGDGTGGRALDAARRPAHLQQRHRRSRGTVAGGGPHPARRRSRPDRGSAAVAPPPGRRTRPGHGRHVHRLPHDHRVVPRAPPHRRPWGRGWPRTGRRGHSQSIIATTTSPSLKGPSHAYRHHRGQRVHR